MATKVQTSFSPEIQQLRKLKTVPYEVRISREFSWGDDVALAKSFSIAYEGPVLNWYSLLQLHSVCSWVDLKTKFMQAFQILHETIAESSNLYNCKQKDREPLRNFVRRFMQ
jgi:hypothetical protein